MERTREKLRRFVAIVVFVLLFASPLPAAAQNKIHSPVQSAIGLLKETAQALGGLDRIRALKNQVVVSEGHHYEPQQALRPGGPPRHVSDYHSTVIRDPANKRLRQEWDAQILYVFQAHVRHVLTINGVLGSVESTGDEKYGPIRMDPGQLVTRLREERRTMPQIVLTALEHGDLKLLPDVSINHRTQHVISFREAQQEFQLFLDVQTKRPSQVDILEDDPTYGDCRYQLHFSDWRDVDGLKMPFDLRYEINGDLLETERYLSVRHNIELASDTFSIPDGIRGQQTDGEPVASEWLLRRLAMNVGYPPSMSSRPPVHLVALADGVFYTKDGIYNSVVIEMRDYLIVVEPVLYEANSVQVIAAIKEQFPDKPIRYIIPTHFHNDHTGGIRTYIAEGATILAPAISVGHYRWVANRPHGLRPDRLQEHPRKLSIERIGRCKVLTDGNHQVEIYPLPTSHAEDFQLIYLPRERLLIEADHMTPSNGQIGQPLELARQLLDGIERLKLNVDRIVGIHGDVGTFEQLRDALRKDRRENPQ
jgi:glyoxylase-like metal-dependent hydrolase (beta-lactamase superfamily II)